MRKVYFQFVGVLAALVVTFAAVYLLFDASDASGIVKYTGYWVVATLVGSSAYYMWRVYGCQIRNWTNWRWHLMGIVVALVCSAFIHLHEPHDFKILYDEHALAGTAMNMHFNREVGSPTRALWYNGEVRIFNSFVDKRPILYPFLVSTLHDLTGYRPQNSFIVNGSLAFLLLLFIYRWGVIVANRLVGIGSVLLFTTLPLFAQVATSGGMDLLNIVLMAAFLNASFDYLKRGDGPSLNLLIVLGVMLSYARYESILFLLVTLILYLWRSFQDKEVRLTWFASASPLFLSIPLLLNRVFMSSDGFFESGKSDYFSLGYVASNLEHAVYYLFNLPSGFVGNSLLLSFIGVAAMIGLLAATATRMKLIRRWPISLQVYLPFATCTLGITFIGMAMFWGQWDDAVVSRLSLPFQLCLTVTVPVFLSFENRQEALGKWFVGCSAAWLFLCSTPQAARHDMTNGLSSVMERRFAMRWASTHMGERDVILMRSSPGAIIHGYASMPFDYSKDHEESFRSGIETGGIRNLYVLERFKESPDGQGFVEKFSDVAPAWAALEELDTIRLRPGMRSRICKVVGTIGPDGEVIPFGKKTHPPFETFEQLTEWYYQQLP